MFDKPSQTKGEEFVETRQAFATYMENVAINL
jgi:hypothetical protein